MSCTARLCVRLRCIIVLTFNMRHLFLCAPLMYPNRECSNPFPNVNFWAGWPFIGSLGLFRNLRWIQIKPINRTCTYYHIDLNTRLVQDTYFVFCIWTIIATVMWIRDWSNGWSSVGCQNVWLEFLCYSGSIVLIFSCTIQEKEEQNGCFYCQNQRYARWNCNGCVNYFQWHFSISQECFLFLKTPKKKWWICGVRTLDTGNQGLCSAYYITNFIIRDYIQWELLFTFSASVNLLMLSMTWFRQRLWFQQVNNC